MRILFIILVVSVNSFGLFAQDTVKSTIKGDFVVNDGAIHNDGTSNASENTAHAKKHSDDSEANPISGKRANIDPNALPAANNLNSVADLSHNQFVSVLEAYNSFYQITPPTLASFSTLRNKLKTILTPGQWKKAQDVGLVDK